MEALWQDIRFSARALLKARGFSLVIVLTLALGIGGNAAIFSLVRTVLLRPLPFNQPEQLIGIRESKIGEGHNNPLAWLSFFEIRDKSQTVESIAAYFNSSFDIGRESGTERVAGARVSHTYFHVLGVHPLLGRDFTAEDDTGGAPGTVILSYELWQQMYGGDPRIVGRNITYDGNSYTIIGVMPSLNDGQTVGGQLGWRAIWTPFRANENRQRTNPGRAVLLNARLKQGVTLQQARAELETLIDGLKKTSSATHSSEIGIYAAPLKDYVINPNAQTALWAMFGAVILVLLIACVNVANLLLARSVECEKEIAVRMALGARASSIARRLLIESVILSISGAVVGWLLATWLIAIAGRFLPEVWQRLGDIHPDARVFAFAFLLALLTGLLSGLAPALGATKVNLTTALKDGARSISNSLSHQRLRNGLVVLEIGLALVLLIGSGLLLSSFNKLLHLDLGFNPDNVLSMTVSLPGNGYRDPAKRINYFQQTINNIKQLPGVQSSAICFSLLMTGEGATDPVTIEGRPPVPKGEEPVLRGGSVSADYFRTMGIAFRRGRSFTDQEVWQGADVIIVNEAFANRFFPNEDPIGKRVRVGYSSTGDGPPYSTVIGVVANHIQPGVDNRIWEEMFYPYVNTADPPLWQMNLVVKTSADPSSMTQAIVEQARNQDHLVPVTRIRPMRELTNEALRNDRFSAWLFGSFSILALLLAMLGLYGVISYSTSQRTGEIGIRIALGAESRDIIKLVVGRGIMLMLAGIGIGLVSAAAATRILSSLLFQVSATDPVTYISVSVLLASVALIACYLPARRASKLDPMVALRHE